MSGEPGGVVVAGGAAVGGGAVAGAAASFKDVSFLRSRKID